MREVCSINLLFPVLNERLRLQSGIERTMSYLKENVDIPYQVTILDNGSTDETPEIAKALEEKYAEVTYIRLEERGVGIAFRNGILRNTCTVVGYMDIDLSTDVRHLQDVLVAFEDDQVFMVNGSRWTKESDANGRKWYRNITSNGLTWLLRISLKMQASDAICGFKFFRKEFVEQLIDQADASENGWFYIIELLLRAERSGQKVYELPVHWEDDSSNSKVEVIPLIRNYCQQIARLRSSFKDEMRAKQLKAG